jgi:hypothetical protein
VSSFQHREASSAIKRRAGPAISGWPRLQEIGISALLHNANNEKFTHC